MGKSVKSSWPTGMKGLQLPACRSTDWEDALGLACEELLAPPYGLTRPAKANHLTS